MRVVFMGTPDFSVPALEKIADKHEVVTDQRDVDIKCSLLL